MPTRTKPRHVVVDGSNLATEGRSMPSLRQLNEAVLAYMEEHPDDVVTVVVDATFGHRIDPREVPEFDAAVDNNELVAPPAGAIGRGDAFVLTIANKVNATIISNDSYQEFHGDYEWLFDEGRLIGGKPVPNVGWVFVPRVPVRGPVSRRAVKDAKKPVKTKAVRAGARASKEASQPMPVPAAPPPGARASTRKDKASAAPAPGSPERASAAPASPKPAKAQPAKPQPAKPQPAKPQPAKQTDAPTATRPHMVNDLLPFLGFVEHHPVGSMVAGVVESYSSHGAYVTVDHARGYVPLRLMAEPVPRSARSIMKLADTVELVVVSFNATRRSIDLAVPGMEPPEVKAVMGAPPRPAKRSRKKAAPEPEAVPAEPVVEPTAAPQPAKRTRKKAAKTAPISTPAEPVAASPTPVKRSRKKAATSAPEPLPPPEPPAAPAAPVKRTRKKAPAS